LNGNQLVKRNISPAGTALFLLCVACALAGACQRGSSAKFRQYYAQGEKLYLKHCSNCHQADGTGLGRVYPPVNDSDYMRGNLEAVICLIRFGKKGELIVNGKQYNQPMPGVSALSDLEIAEVATYIYNMDNQKRGLIEVKTVSAILNKCQSRR
jgi:mono/diheme cytochrome c family protein